MLKEMKFMLGNELGRYQASIAQMIEPYKQSKSYVGFGYMKAEADANGGFVRTWGKETVPKYSSLNGYFVKEGEDFPCCNFQEPWMNKQGKCVPRLEIFFEDDLYLKEGLVHSLSSQLMIN